MELQRPPWRGQRTQTLHAEEKKLTSRASRKPY